MCGSSEHNKYKQKQKTRLWERRLSSVAPGPGGVELALLVKVEGDARVGDAEVVNHIHVPHLVREGHHQVPRQAADVVQVRRGDLGAVAVRHVGPQAALANEGLHRPVEGEHRHPPGEEAPRGPALARPLVVHRGVAEAVGHGVLVENVDVRMESRDAGDGVHPEGGAVIGERQHVFTPPRHVEALLVRGHLRVLFFVAEHRVPGLHEAGVEHGPVLLVRVAARVAEALVGEPRAHLGVHGGPQLGVVDQRRLPAGQGARPVFDLEAVEQQYPRRLGEEGHLGVVGDGHLAVELGTREHRLGARHRQPRGSAEVNVLQILGKISGELLKPLRIFGQVRKATEDGRAFAELVRVARRPLLELGKGDEVAALHGLDDDGTPRGRAGAERGHVKRRVRGQVRKGDRGRELAEALELGHREREVPVEVIGRHEATDKLDCKRGEDNRKEQLGTLLLLACFRGRLERLGFAALHFIVGACWGLGLGHGRLLVKRIEQAVNAPPFIGLLGPRLREDFRRIAVDAFVEEFFQARDIHFGCFALF
mmetsp:Transcript_6278/g.14425  ORF Transcript_6278/g.14425 Transcript_6278/m.14425 type:complete len:537 (+) Transcript_6278:238-1848(+)